MGHKCLRMWNTHSCRALNVCADWAQHAKKPENNNNNSDDSLENYIPWINICHVCSSPLKSSLAFSPAHPVNILEAQERYGWMNIVMYLVYIVYHHTHIHTHTHKGFGRNCRTGALPSGTTSPQTLSVIVVLLMPKHLPG